MRSNFLTSPNHQVLLWLTESENLRQISQYCFSPADNKQKYENQGVWVLKGNEPERIDVELGLSDDSKTQIISDKIKEKDKVIISAQTKGKKKQPQSMRRHF